MIVQNDICSKLLECASGTDLISDGWISAIAAAISAIAAGFGLYYSHKAKDQTYTQANRETFDRMHGEDFSNAYKQFDGQFKILRSNLISQQLTAPQVANITALAQALPTDDLKKICSEIDPQQKTSLLNDANDIDSEIINLVGVVSLQTTGWHGSANDLVQQIQDSLIKVRKTAFTIRNTFQH